MNVNTIVNSESAEREMIIEPKKFDFYEIGKTVISQAIISIPSRFTICNKGEISSDRNFFNPTV